MAVPSAQDRSGSDPLLLSGNNRRRGRMQQAARRPSRVWTTDAAVGHGAGVQGRLRASNETRGLPPPNGGPSPGHGLPAHCAGPVTAKPRRAHGTACDRRTARRAFHQTPSSDDPDGREPGVDVPTRPQTVSPAEPRRRLAATPQYPACERSPGPAPQRRASLPPTRIALMITTSRLNPQTARTALPARTPSSQAAVPSHSEATNRAACAAPSRTHGSVS